MAKAIKVEASLATCGRFRDGSAKAKFIIYDRKSNETIYESEIYSQRSNAKRGADRYCASNGYVVGRWVK